MFNLFKYKTSNNNIMPDYSKSKIYKITGLIYIGLIYIGSTTQTLSERIRDHKKTIKVI